MNRKIRKRKRMIAKQIEFENTHNAKSSNESDWLDNYKPTGKFVSKFSKVNSRNSNQGFETEQKVKKMLSRQYEVFNVSRNQHLSDMETGIPDLVIIKNNKKRYVEVKSIKTIHKERGKLTGGRVQFHKPKLKELADKNGLVIIEKRLTDEKGRETGKLEYKVANAKDVYILVKDESGNSVKIEYHELEYFQKLDVKKLP